MPRPRLIGFTLAELLIALAILGIIATFTIPKILSTQQNAQSKAIAKEVAGMVSGAYLAYKHQNSITASTGIKDLTPYLNYVSVDTTSSIDWHTLGSPESCDDSGFATCLKLHNGAMMRYGVGNTFGGTGTMDAVWFQLDPDGQVNNTASGLSVQFWLYTDGRLTTNGTMLTNSCTNNGSYGCGYNPDTSTDPPWFSW